MNNENHLSTNILRSKSTLLKPITKTKGTNPQKNMLSLDKLNGILHKLKMHYNDLNNIRKAKDAKVSLLDKKKSDLQKQIQCKENFADIDFPSEKISIKDYEKLKETKEEIQEKIENLINKKNVLSLKYHQEVEYTDTLHNLIQIEKKNYENLNEHLFQTQDKIKTVRTAKKNLEINREEYLKRQKIFTNFQKLQKEECEKLDDVLKFQNMKNINISQSLQEKLDENQELKKQICSKEHTLELEFKLTKERVLDELNKNEKIKVEKLNEQNKLIKLILGLDIIKKFFIDLDKKNIEINNSNLLKSEEYKVFTAREYIVIDEDNNIVNTNNNCSENTDDANTPLRIDKASNLNKYNLRLLEDNYFGPALNTNPNINANNASTSQRIMNMTNNYFSKSTVNFHNYSNNNFLNKSQVNTLPNNKQNKENSLKCRVYLRDIKDKLDSLDLDYETMNNFYTKIINKTNFFHNHMINFNLKQISLESSKENYCKRVKEIIEQNSKSIEDLIKFNSKFDNLLKAFGLDIRNDNLKKLIKEKLRNLEFISKVSLSKFEEFYSKCKKFSSDWKTFNDFVLVNLEKIIDETSADENLKENLKKISSSIKKNFDTENEKAQLFDNDQFLAALISQVEKEFIRENGKLEKIEIAISQKKKKELQDNRNQEEPKDLPYIEPYSKWNIEELEIEKGQTNAKRKILKDFLNLKTFFDCDANKANVFAIELPLEKGTFCFLDGVKTIMENLRLTKQVLDSCNSLCLLDKSSFDLGQSFVDGTTKLLYY